MATEVESKLFSLFSDFIRDLSKTFPEIKNSLYRNYESCLTDTGDKCLDDFPKLNTFLELIGENKIIHAYADEELGKVGITYMVNDYAPLDYYEYIVYPKDWLHI